MFRLQGSIIILGIRCYESHYSAQVSVASSELDERLDPHDAGMSTHVWLPLNSNDCSAEPTSSPALNLTAVTGRKRNAFPLMQALFRSVQYLHFSESRSFTPSKVPQLAATGSQIPILSPSASGRIGTWELVGTAYI